MQNAPNITHKMLKVVPKWRQDGTNIDAKWDQEGAERIKKERSQHKAEYFPSPRPILEEKKTKLVPS